MPRKRKRDAQPDVDTVAATQITPTPYTPPSGSPSRARRTLGDTMHNLPTQAQSQAQSQAQPANGSTGAPTTTTTTTTTITPTRLPQPTRPANPTQPPAHASARIRRPTRPTLPPESLQSLARYDEAGLAELDIFTTDERRAVMGGDNAPRRFTGQPTYQLQSAPPDALSAPEAGMAPAGSHALMARPDAASRAIAARTDDAAAPLLIRGASKAPVPYRHIVPPRQSGPRSFITQFVIAMVCTAVIFTTLTLASPLGRAPAIADSFQAYANAIPLAPTPTHTPKPSAQYGPPSGGGNPGKQAIINDIIAVFGPYANGALAVSRCESGYDPNAWNPYPILGSHAEGVFQILYPSTWNGTSYRSYSPYNYDANIHAAHQIFARDGYTWREWQCQP
ncbi:MAG: hypothetical protein ABI068_15915 [Ktedonobacterales bacterium]